MSKHYVNRESLRLELIASNMKGELTPACLEMLMLMVDHIQRPFHYEDPQDREDCRSAAIEVILMKWKTFDLSRQNPFAYFTRMIYNGLYGGWNVLTKKRADFSLSSIFTESI